MLCVMNSSRSLYITDKFIFVTAKQKPCSKRQRTLILSRFPCVSFKPHKVSPHIRWNFNHRNFFLLFSGLTSRLLSSLFPNNLIESICADNIYYWGPQACFITWDIIIRNPFLGVGIETCSFWIFLRSLGSEAAYHNHLQLIKRSLARLTMYAGKK